MKANLENSAVATGFEKVSFHSNPKERQCQKKFIFFKTIALISLASKVIFKMLLRRIQQYMNRELSDVHNGFRKGRGTRDQLPTSIGSYKKQGNSEKNLLVLY